MPLNQMYLRRFILISLKLLHKYLQKTKQMGRKFKAIIIEDDESESFKSVNGNGLHQRGRETMDQDQKTENSNYLIHRFSQKQKQHQLQFKSLGKMYAGSLTCFGVVNVNFSTHGKQVQLRPFIRCGSMSHTLFLSYRENENQIMVPTILGGQLNKLIHDYKHLGNVRFFCKSGANHDKQLQVQEEQNLDKGKQKRKYGQARVYQTASKNVKLKKCLKKIMVIRMDVYINKQIFNEQNMEYSNKIKTVESLRVIRDQLNTKSQQYSDITSQLNKTKEQLEDQQVARGILLYFMEKANIKVLNRSFIKPPPKLNALMKHYRAKTIGLITKNKRYARRIQQKILNWKREYQYLSLFYPCILADSLIDKYYQRLPLKCIVWKNDPTEFYKEIQEEEAIKLQGRQNRSRQIVPESDSQFLRLNMKRVMNEIGAHGFGDDEGDQEEEQQDEESKISQGGQKMDIDELALLKKNKSLMERFETQNKHFKKHPKPPHMISQLKPYQQQALQWMKYREGKISVEDLFEAQYRSKADEEEFQRKLSPFWEEIITIEGDKFYANYLTGEFTQQFHDWKSIKGGILADQMGLGKTVMTLSLLADENFAGLNLIVVPVTVLLQWKSQIQKHCGAGVKVFEFHSNSKNRRKVNLKDYQVILVTYQTLGNQYKSYKNRGQQEEGKFLFDYQFQRVILDEAHNIKGTKTYQFNAVMELKSMYSWCLTGTLIQNSQQDLFAIFKFLRVQVFSEESWWHQYIKKAGCLQAKLNVIQTVLRPIVLRRTKKSTSNEGQSILQLVMKHEYKIRPTFSEIQKSIYEKLKAGARQYFRNNSQNHSYTHIFQIICKLRQFCCHPALLFKLDEEDMNEKNIEKMIADFLQVKIKGQYKEKAMEAIMNGEQSCPICLDIPTEDNVTFTSCGHIYCAPCLTKSIASSGVCAICRSPLNNQSYAMKSDFMPPENFKQMKESTKVNEILKLLRKIEDRGEKCVVFTQWKKIIDILEEKLLKKGVEFATIQGSMSKQKRQRAVKRFEEKPTCRFLIASIRAAGTGLNLAFANNVIICDPWWNPAQEDQAIGRIHRWGQTKQVNVYRILMKDSIEERIEQMHHKKRTLAEQVMMQKGSLDQKKDSVEELLSLLD